MRRGLVVLALALTGCASVASWWAANKGAVVTDVENGASCVIGWALSGQTSAASIATECGGMAVTDVLQVCASTAAYLDGAIPVAGDGGTVTVPIKSVK